MTLTQVLNCVINATMLNYRGRLIEMENSHSFRVGRNHYASLEDAKRGVDASFNDLALSVNRIKVKQ